MIFNILLFIDQIPFLLKMDDTVSQEDPLYSFKPLEILLITLPILFNFIGHLILFQLEMVSQSDSDLG